MIKKIALASIMAAGVTTAASANALLNDNPYTGFNLGVQGGFNYNDFDSTVTNTVTGSFDDDYTGGMLGIFLGFGHQTDNNVYFGIEAEGNYQFGDASKTATVNTVSFTAKAEADYSFAFNAQLGYVFDPGILVYLFGGVNLQEYEIQLINNATTLTKKDDELYVGFKIGAGARYKFYDQVFGDIKYDYNHFSDESVTIGGTTQRLKVEPDQHNVRIGVGMII